MTFVSFGLAIAATVAVVAAAILLAPPAIASIGVISAASAFISGFGVTTAELVFAGAIGALASLLGAALSAIFGTHTTTYQLDVKSEKFDEVKEAVYKRVGELEKELEEKEAKKKEAVAGLVSSQKETLAAKDKEIAALRSEINQRKDAFNVEQARLLSQTQIETGKVDSLRKEFDEAKKAHAKELESLTNELKSKLDELAALKNFNQDAKIKAEAEWASLSANIEASKQRIQDYADQVAELRKQQDAIEGDDSKKQAFQALEEKKAPLSKSWNEEVAHFDHLRKTLKESKSAYYSALEAAAFASQEKDKKLEALTNRQRLVNVGTKLKAKSEWSDLLARIDEAEKKGKALVELVEEYQTSRDQIRGDESKKEQFEQLEKNIEQYRKESEVELSKAKDLKLALEKSKQDYYASLETALFGTV